MGPKKRARDLILGSIIERYPKGRVVTYVPQVIAIVDVVVVFTTCRCWEGFNTMFKVTQVRQN
jgi:hypothetical protein